MLPACGGRLEFVLAARQAYGDEDLNSLGDDCTVASSLSRWAAGVIQTTPFACWSA